jgi:protein-S-isoprenylcysteine O-methyltransferase Ste14
VDPTFETPFRIIFGMLLVIGLAIRVYFQKQVAAVERVARRHERRDRFFYNLVLASYLLMFLYVFTPWLDFAHLPLPAWLRWVGALIACAGTGLFSWSHQTLGANWSGILEISKGHRFVSEGPYRYVRHPMYSAFFVLGLGLLLLSANWLIGVSHLAAVTWMYRARVASEEALMSEHFGDTYRQYMATTGRLLPRLKASRTTAKGKSWRS